MVRCINNIPVRIVDDNIYIDMLDSVYQKGWRIENSKTFIESIKMQKKMFGKGNGSSKTKFPLKPLFYVMNELKLLLSLYYML